MNPNFVNQNIIIQLSEELDVSLPEDFKTIAKFTYEQAIQLLDTTHKVITVEGYKVKTDNPRYPLVIKNQKCVWCAVPIKIAYLRTQAGTRPGGYAVFTFHDEHDSLLYTKDHIMPRKRGGPNAGWNYQNMCHVCNQEKGHGHPHSDRFARRHLLYTPHEKETELWLRKQFGAHR